MDLSKGTKQTSAGKIKSLTLSHTAQSYAAQSWRRSSDKTGRLFCRHRHEGLCWAVWLIQRLGFGCEGHRQSHPTPPKRILPSPHTQKSHTTAGPSTYRSLAPRGHLQVHGNGTGPAHAVRVCVYHPLQPKVSHCLCP